MINFIKTHNDSKENYNTVIHHLLNINAKIKFCFISNDYKINLKIIFFTENVTNKSKFYLFIFKYSNHKFIKNLLSKIYINTNYKVFYLYIIKKSYNYHYSFLY